MADFVSSARMAGKLYRAGKSAASLPNDGRVKSARDAITGAFAGDEPVQPIGEPEPLSKKTVPADAAVIKRSDPQAAVLKQQLKAADQLLRVVRATTPELGEALARLRGARAALAEAVDNAYSDGSPSSADPRVISLSGYLNQAHRAVQDAHAAASSS